MQIIGHRGARGLWPENTIGGFKNALKAGVEAFELDVHLSLDSIFLVHHDRYLNPDLTRIPMLTGDKPYIGRSPIVNDFIPIAIHDRNAAIIQSYDVGRINPKSEYAKQFPYQQPIDGEYVPTLKDVLTLLCGHAAVTIEIKMPKEPSHLDQVMYAEALKQMLNESTTPWDDITISSFDWNLLTHVRKLIPDIPIAALMEKNYTGTSSIKTHGFQIWSPEYTNLNQSFIDEAHSEGLKVVTWTVNDWDQIKILEKMGVDGVITDYPIKPSKYYYEIFN